MITELTEQSFEQALTDCGRLPNYEAVVILPQMREIRNVADELQRIHNIKPIPYLSNIVSNYSFSLLRFNNGSSLEITSAETVQRGDRYHTILLSPDITDQDFRIMSECLEKVYEEHDAPLVYRRPQHATATKSNYLIYAKGDWADVKVVVPDQTDNEDDASELDSFLNKFKINS